MTASSDSVPSSSDDLSSTDISQRQPHQAQSSFPISQSASTVPLSNERRSKGNWLWLLGLALLCLGGGFFLWRAIAGQRGGEMQGPPAFPVTMERLQESSLENSSEYVGTLDAQAGVSLQPESDGRIVQIFVSSGDTVAAGDPIMQLSPQRSQADYNSALAGVSAARSARDTAGAQLRAARERQTQLLADLELQETDFNRTAVLVDRGALPQEDLDEVRRDRAVAGSALNSAIEEIAALESSLAGAEATLSQAQANANATQQDLLDKT
ncbi:MAG: biotin/lipoyl-binding protein, partial [Cyanobacteria bacterium J06632_3]